MKRQDPEGGVLNRWANYSARKIIHSIKSKKANYNL